jgi:hypothetical protein
MHRVIAQTKPLSSVVSVSDPIVSVVIQVEAVALEPEVASEILAPAFPCPSLAHLCSINGLNDLHRVIGLACLAGSHLCAVWR